MVSPEEIALFPIQKEIAMRTLAEIKFPPTDLYKLRYSRNNWFTHRNGNRLNGLQHSMGLAFDDRGMILLEFLILIDITHFNDSPHHFYKITKVEDDGSETVLTHGTLEETGVTPREREVLALLATGATSEEIAARLRISAETVKVHRRKLLEKTKSANSIDLLRYGFAQGWL
jgi:DNA-binding CsgD family transcriptional regulator